MGGPIGYLLNHFGLRETSGEEEEAAYEDVPGLMGRGRSNPVPAVGPVYYDRKYIKPLLTPYQWTGDASAGHQEEEL